MNACVHFGYLRRQIGNPALLNVQDLETGQVLEAGADPGHPGVGDVQLLKGVSQAVQRIVADVLDGRVHNLQHLDSQVVEHAAVELLYVAVGDPERVDQGLDLSETQGQGGQVGVGAVQVDALLRALGAVAGVDGPGGALVLGRRVDPFLPEYPAHRKEDQDFEQVHAPAEFELHEKHFYYIITIVFLNIFILRYLWHVHTFFPVKHRPVFLYNLGIYT